MTAPTASLITGNRLHLQHGPIDLIIGADGNHKIAFKAATTRFKTVLTELVEELDELRQPFTPQTSLPTGETARRMHQATRSLHNGSYLTRMASVAGSVAETILEAMVNATALRSAYVNNGGDIALHLTQGQCYTTGMSCVNGADLGRVNIHHRHAVRGIATSGWRGRSYSVGIADSVTVLAATASIADAAATIIANAIDLPGHTSIQRTPASQLSDDSDLGELPVVTHVGRLSTTDCLAALDAGVSCADTLQQSGHIAGAALFLQDQVRTLGFADHITSQSQQRKLVNV